MTLEAVPAQAKPIAFDVVDVLGRFTSLGRRTPTLDGGVPIRVAQGCVPLLEGNAWGWQLALGRRIELRRSRLGAWQLAAPTPHVDALDRLTRAAVPMLLREGTLRPGAWVKRLEHGALACGRTLSLFTGLFVRPRPEHRLRIATLGNRRSWLYTIDEAIYDDADAFTPLVLDVTPARDADSLILDGEVASLGILPAHITFSRCALEDAPEVAHAHVDFYDARYFETKKRGEVARKYRDSVTRAPRPAAPDAAAPHARVVDGGPSLVEPGLPAQHHRSTGSLAAPSTTPPDRLVVRNAVSFAATFDGYTLVVTPDRAELDRFAADVRAAWQRWQEQANRQFHEGALLYLTKYVTPHPAGEPHFFVKPPSLVATTPGTSTLIDGRAGAGFDIMRGVIHSDAFHAAPAVFHLWRPGETLRIPRGAPLADLFVVSRAFDDASFTLATGGPGGSWA